MAAARGYVLVYEVLHDTNTDGGPAGDGTYISRFRSKVEAERFADRSTCYGRAAKVQENDVPRRLAQRWGVC